LASGDQALLTSLREADAQGTLREQAARYAQTVTAGASRSGPTGIRRLALYGLARSVWHQFSGTGGFPAGLAGDSSYEAAARRPFGTGMDAPIAFRTVFQDVRLHSLAVNLDDPRIVEGLRILLTALEQIRANAERSGASLAVGLIHNKPFVLQPVIQANRPDIDQVLRSQVAMEMRVTERLVGELSDRRFQLIDTGRAMRAAVERGIMPYRESDDHHPNPVGYEIIASAIFDGLVQNRAVFPQGR
jgi:hypothetical protein